LGVGCWALVVGRSILFAAYPFKVAKNQILQIAGACMNAPRQIFGQHGYRGSCPRNANLQNPAS
jgi:hypothetical protein